MSAFGTEVPAGVLERFGQMTESHPEEIFAGEANPCHRRIDTEWTVVFRNAIGDQPRMCHA